ncbi:hypothetical protein CHS0354_020964 [Potamilus streckersoni]|uniref:Uncharacterized protein n=1 Tax=Potamilus streckersoni TaxID=2493646 RepID=A0AAE0SB45_9BIVA|nr:hypothetical protein CHS0354_020964 [Potamilus streckersoni]
MLSSYALTKPYANDNKRCNFVSIDKITGSTECIAGSILSWGPDYTDSSTPLCVLHHAIYGDWYTLDSCGR